LTGAFNQFWNCSAPNTTMAWLPIFSTKKGRLSALSFDTAKLESYPSVGLGAADLTSLVFADHFPPGSSDGICPLLIGDNLAQRALCPPGLLCGAPPRAAIFPKTSGMERATAAPLKTHGPLRSKATLYCLNLVSRTYPDPSRPHADFCESGPPGACLQAPHTPPGMSLQPVQPRCPGGPCHRALF